MIVLKSQEFVHSFINSTPVQAVINQGLSLGWKLGPGDFRSFGFVVVQLLSRVQIFCDPKDCTPPGSSVHRISQARILEWVAISFSRESSQPRDQIHVCCIDRWILYHWAIREVQSGLGFITNTQMHLFARLTSVSNLFWSSWCYSLLLLGYCFSLATSSRFRDRNPSTA